MIVIQDTLRPLGITRCYKGFLHTAYAIQLAVEDESRLEGSASLPLTHDQMARHLGTAREVVTRMLKYFQTEGLVRLSRGGVELTAPEALEKLAKDSLR